MKGYYVYEIGPPKVLIAIVGPFPYGGPDNVFYDSVHYVVTNGLLDGATVTTVNWQKGPSNPDTATDGAGLPVAKSPGQGEMLVLENAAAGATYIILCHDGADLSKLIYHTILIATDDTADGGKDGGGMTITKHVILKSELLVNGTCAGHYIDKPLPRAVVKGEIVSVA